MLHAITEITIENIKKNTFITRQIKNLVCKDESRDEEFQQKSEEIADEISKIIEEVNDNLPNDNKLAIKQNKNKESISYLQFSLIAKHFSLRLAKTFG